MVKSESKFKTLDSLESIKKILSEIDDVLKDKKFFWIIGLLSFPHITLSLGIYNYFNKKKGLKKEKEILLIEAIRKQNAIIKILEEEVNISKNELEKLKKYNELLRTIINDLTTDLKN